MGNRGATPLATRSETGGNAGNRYVDATGLALALAALDRVTAMASPTYGLNVVAVAVVLAAAIVLLASNLVPYLADLI